MHRIIETENLNVWHSTITRVEKNLNSWSRKYNRNVRIQSFLRPKERFSIDIQID